MTIPKPKPQPNTEPGPVDVAAIRRAAAEAQALAVRLFAEADAIEGAKQERRAGDERRRKRREALAHMIDLIAIGMAEAPAAIEAAERYDLDGRALTVMYDAAQRSMTRVGKAVRDAKIAHLALVQGVPDAEIAEIVALSVSRVRQVIRDAREARRSNPLLARHLRPAPPQARAYTARRKGRAAC